MTNAKNDCKRQRIWLASANGRCKRQIWLTDMTGRCEWQLGMTDRRGCSGQRVPRVPSRNARICTYTRLLRSKSPARQQVDSSWSFHGSDMMVPQLNPPVWLPSSALTRSVQRRFGLSFEVQAISTHGHALYVQIFIRNDVRLMIAVCNVLSFFPTLQVGVVRFWEESKLFFLPFLPLLLNIAMNDRCRWQKLMTFIWMTDANDRHL